MYCSIDDQMIQYKMLNTKFLDKILKEYDYTNISIGTLKPLPFDHVLQPIKGRARSSNLNIGYRRKKRTESIVKKQDRECTLINDPTLDSLEVQKIDEAIAKITNGTK